MHRPSVHDPQSVLFHRDQIPCWPLRIRTGCLYSRSGKAISKSQLQPGDVITFSYGSGVAHIGIYIGGGSFVHAAGNGSGTVGQYPNQCVKTASLSGYWENHAYNYRRLY